MLVVSHDRRFLDTVCERLWVVDDGAVAPFDGGYRAWRQAVTGGWTVASALEHEARRLQPHGAALRSREDRAAAAPSPSKAGTAQTPAPAASSDASRNGRDGRRPGKAQERLSKDAYRRQREMVDAELTRLGLRKNHLELELSKPAVQANFIELRRVSSELADVQSALGAAEDAWLALEERAP
jgi:ATPase subunit of ABC transporter with duplicated ATPase domains